MSEKLTDAELLAAQGNPSENGWQYGSVKALRAVQDAVLEKAEVETRERERKAFCDGAIWVGSCGQFAANAARNHLAECDRRFPSLRRPASVTLSTGTWTKERNGDWTLANYSGRSQAPQAATPADCDALKAYLQAMEGK